MIIRIWHAWATPSAADDFQSFFESEVAPSIKRRNIDGFRDIQLVRRNAAAEVEFVTIMRFDTLEAVKAFAGEDYAVAVVPDKARAVLSRYEDRAAHYELVVTEASNTGKSARKP